MPNIEDLIQKAIEAGKFDNLSGKGKPLHLEDNPLADPEWKMAYHILKNAGFSLPWLETRRDILEELEKHRFSLRQAWEWRQAALARGEEAKWVEAEWQRALSAFQEKLAQLNQRIRTFNLQAPNERFQLQNVQIEAEIKAITQ